MGLNTVVLILNDFLHEMAEDPKLGEKLLLAINSGNKKPCKGMSIVECHHADDEVVILAHGNTAQRLDDDGIRDLLKSKKRKENRGKDA